MYKVKSQRIFVLFRVDLGIGEFLVTLSLFIVSHGSLKQLTSQVGVPQPRVALNFSSLHLQR